MDKQQLKEMGSRLREKRGKLGLTREQFAELADISPGYYGQIEVGTSQMSIDTLLKLSSSMHLSMEYIMTGKEREETDTAPIIELLNNCSERELNLASQMLKLFLMKND